MHRAFLLHFNNQPPTRKSICRWNHWFEQTGCLCKGKSSGRPRVSEENVRRIKESFERSPYKSTRRASRELEIPQPSGVRWGAVYCSKPYRLHLVQALRPNDKWKSVEFCDCMLQNTEDDTFLPPLIFSDEATFHLSGKVNRHNVLIWGLQNPQEALEHERDPPKVNVFCALSQTKVNGPIFFCWKHG